MPVLTLDVTVYFIFNYEVCAWLTWGETFSHLSYLVFLFIVYYMSFLRKKLHEIRCGLAIYKCSRVVGLKVRRNCWCGRWRCGCYSLYLPQQWVIWWPSFSVWDCATCSLFWSIVSIALHCSTLFFFAFCFVLLKWQFFFLNWSL